ncbi:expressed unknown protein [Seminavis robusta]|uniref:Uncharacterized protein n=1 Tax=Seminavis robusta TaxID=568900 RepID=A0A9N8E3T4_9STRA|nr:expressed unknown protein [Seminavis robusta]|eukprot:Sro495_g154510.1 n/a (354) ;mRNA; r:39574-41006
MKEATLSVWDRCCEFILHNIPLDSLPLLSNDGGGGEAHSVLFWVGCLVTVAFLAHFLNRLFFLIDRPVQDKNIMELRRRQQQSSSSDRALGKKEFPWRRNDDNEGKSVVEISKDFLKALPIISWIISLLDFEGRRHRKWDEDRRKWRELQQQLSTLRSIRAQRWAARKEAQKTQPGAKDQTTERNRPEINLSKFPWKSSSNTTTTNNSLGAAVISFLPQWMDLSWFLLSKEERRKQNWEKECLKWRELQQQLGTLRFIRAQRQASGEISTGSNALEEEAINPERQVFPWNKDELWTMEWLLELIASCFEVFSFQSRRQVKLDSDREKWRELQQQLARLRSIRAQRRNVKTACL